MGVSFIFEVVSSLFSFKINPVTEYIEVVWDFVNCLQGNYKQLKNVQELRHIMCHKLSHLLLQRHIM